MKRSGGLGKWYVAGGGAILLFGVLLLFRLGIPEIFINRQEATFVPTQTGATAREAWMNVIQGGRKIGYARRTHAPTDTFTSVRL